MRIIDARLQSSRFVTPFWLPPATCSRPGNKVLIVASGRMRVDSKTRRMFCRSALRRSGGIARSDTKDSRRRWYEHRGDFISHQGQNHKIVRLNLAASFQTLRGGSFRNNTTIQIVISNSGVSQHNPQIITTTLKIRKLIPVLSVFSTIPLGEKSKAQRFWVPNWFSTYFPKDLIVRTGLLRINVYLIGSALTLPKTSLSGQAYFELTFNTITTPWSFSIEHTVGKGGNNSGIPMQDKKAMLTVYDGFAGQKECLYCSQLRKVR